MCALWIVMNFKTTVVGVARAKFPFFGKKLPSTTCAHCDMDILQTLCTYIHYSGPPLERPFILPEKSGLSKGVASQEGDISMHFWFFSWKEVASQEGVASHERGLSRGGPLYYHQVKILYDTGCSFVPDVPPPEVYAHSYTLINFYYTTPQVNATYSHIPH